MQRPNKMNRVTTIEIRFAKTFFSHFSELCIRPQRRKGFNLYWCDHYRSAYSHALTALLLNPPPPPPEFLWPFQIGNEIKVHFLRAQPHNLFPTKTNAQHDGLQFNNLITCISKRSSHFSQFVCPPEDSILRLPIESVNRITLTLVHRHHQHTTTDSWAEKWSTRHIQNDPFIHSNLRLQPSTNRPYARTRQLSQENVNPGPQVDPLLFHYLCHIMIIQPDRNHTRRTKPPPSNRTTRSDLISSRRTHNRVVGAPAWQAFTPTMGKFSLPMHRDRGTFVDSPHDLRF